MAPNPLILDTDGGVDDAQALLLLIAAGRTPDAITTVFGNVMREAAGGGKAWISSMTKRAAPGADIDIPLAHKDALYVRSHYDGMTLTLPDAPQPNEIAIIAVYATRGRPNQRVGGLSASEIRGQDGLT